MQLEQVEIKSLTMDPANARMHSSRNLESIKASLNRFGQQKPIVVTSSGVVVAGNGTLAAALALGWDEIKAVRTPLVGSEATAYGIADNRTSELAGWDNQVLGELLASLQIEDEALLKASGFTDDELTALVNDNVGLAPESFPEFGEDMAVEHECPSCGYGWSGKPK